MSSSLMEWKLEPLTPQNSSEESWVSNDDITLYWTTLEQNNELNDDYETLESKAEVASKILDDLNNLNDLDDLIKEEPFVNWLEDKVIPIFEDVIPSPSPIHIKSEHHFVSNVSVAATPIANPPDTQSLLQEFETIFDAVEMTHVALTPPQSPKYKPHLLTLTPVQESNKQQQFIASSPCSTFLLSPNPFNNNNVSPPTPQLDVDHELAVVEELVRTRVQDMVHSPLSPSSTSSSSSNFGDCSSDDPEWTPKAVEGGSLHPDVIPFVPRSDRDAMGATGRRPKPYSRGVPSEDRRSRKKEQNKNAATRYRMKKKAEVEEILDEEKNLAKQNDELENKITDMNREIKYLKGLMRDLFKAKGLLK